MCNFPKKCCTFFRMTLLFFLLLLSLCELSIAYSFLKTHKIVRNAVDCGRMGSKCVLLRSSVESSDIVPISNELSGLDYVKQKALTYYKFSRPHTIKGTALASCMGVIRALKENPQFISSNLIPRAIIGLFALLCGNLYIVGINQIYDVEIDKINKPFLPIAAQSLSKEVAWVVILAALATGILTVKYNFSPVILQLYLVGVVLGTCYSLPGIQFKQQPILAALTIALVRGFLLNFGIYYAVRETLSIPFQWSAVVIFVATVMTSFAAVIAITKDLPDIEGDRRHNIQTFASKYGPKHVAFVATVVLSLTYAGAMLVPALCFPKHFHLPVLIVGHLLATSYLWYQYFLLARDQSTVKRFYKAIWDLFYLEYLFYPFI